MQDNPKGSFDSETMAMLTRVLDEALEASMRFRNHLSMMQNSRI
jgi:hypothetical protein